jgi:hypothetical protein
MEGADVSFDPVATAGLVTREVRSGSRDGTPTKIAIARRSYPTDRADLWDALTNAERIPRWFLPVSGELKVGGRYQLEGNAGGTVSWLDVTLIPDGERTTLELAHEASLPPGMWEQFGPGATGVGWDLGLRGLGLFLDSGAPVDPATAVTFPASPEGAEFIRQAAAGWADAAVKDGAEAGAAHEAAMRTAAFYTPPPEAVPGT